MGHQGSWGIFRLNGDGSGYKILYHRWRLGPDGRAFRSLVDGDYGYLYGAQEVTEQDASTGRRVWVEFFRLSKQGGKAEVIHVGPAIEARREENNRAIVFHGVAVKLVAGGDGALYGYTNYSLEWDAGHIFRMNRDGSGYTVLHRCASWGGHLVEAGGMQFFLENLNNSNRMRLQRLATDGASYPTPLDADIVGISAQAVNLLGHNDALFGTYMADMPDHSQRMHVYRVGLASLPPPMPYSSGVARPADSHLKSFARVEQRQDQQRAALDERMGRRRTPVPVPARAQPPQTPERRGVAHQPTGRGTPAERRSSPAGGHPPPEQAARAEQQQQQQQQQEQSSPPAEDVNRAAEATRKAAEKINNAARSLRDLFRR